MRYYISDCHFFHESMNTSMDCRGFKDVDSMNQLMVQRWNRKVGTKDEVVVLGDFSLGTAAVSYTHLDVYKRQISRRPTPPI